MQLDGSSQQARKHSMNHILALTALWTTAKHFLCTLSEIFENAY